MFYPTDRERSYWPAQEHRVRIESMRPQVDELALERNGFVLVREPTKVSNFYDADEVKRVYYPEVHRSREAAQRRGESHRVRRESRAATALRPATAVVPRTARTSTTATHGSAVRRGDPR